MKPFFPLPWRLVLAIRRLGIHPSAHLLIISVPRQRLIWLEHAGPLRRTESTANRYLYVVIRQLVISTSRFGVGQIANSNATPLGLHRVAEKIGAGFPVGTVFQGRKPVGFTWQGHPQAPIAHRILWLEGLEPGFNRGGVTDSFQRHIYIHGLGNEPTLGKPASRGCIHLAANDLMPLFDRLPAGTLVWIAKDTIRTPAPRPTSALFTDSSRLPR